MTPQWNEFSCILRPSSLGGIGVFAAHDIPAGTPIFSGNFSPRKARIKDIPLEFQKFCILLNEEECLCPERFDRMEIGWFINHSFQPNISKITDNRVIAIRDIKTGEEIFMDYNQLNEPEHLKEDYYRHRAD
jgi:SET domain-containing protein